jgi:hypothetical protein
VGERYFPFVTYFLTSPHINKPIDSIVDTGSPFTALSTNEILSTRMPIHTMQKGEMVSLAGFRFFRYPINNVTLKFKTETGELFAGKLSTISALVPTKLDKKTLNDVKSIPSIVGHDFMEENKIAFYFNPSAKITYLEYDVPPVNTLNRVPTT